MAVFLAPFRSPLFVDESRLESQPFKDAGDCLAVGDFRFRLQPPFVSFDRAFVSWRGFVSHGPVAAILANPENLARGTKPPVGGVVERVALERPRSIAPETEPFKHSLELGTIGNLELHFRFHQSSLAKDPGL